MLKQVHKPNYTKKVHNIDFSNILRLEDEIQYYTHYNIDDIYIGGSYARNMANEKSDLDVFIKFKDDNINYKKLYNIKLKLKKKYGQWLSLLVFRKNTKHLRMYSLKNKKPLQKYNTDKYYIGSRWPFMGTKVDTYVKFKKYKEYINKVKYVIDNEKINNIKILNKNTERSFVFLRDAPDVIRDLYSIKNK